MSGRCFLASKLKESWIEFSDRFAKLKRRQAIIGWVNLNSCVQDLKVVAKSVDLPLISNRVLQHWIVSAGNKDSESRPLVTDSTSTFSSTSTV